MTQPNVLGRHASNDCLQIQSTVNLRPRPAAASANVVSTATWGEVVDLSLLEIAESQAQVSRRLVASSPT